MREEKIRRMAIALALFTPFRRIKKMRKTERGERSLKFDNAVLIEKFVSASAKFCRKVRIIVHGVFEIYAAAFVAYVVKIAARRG